MKYTSIAILLFLSSCTGQGEFRTKYNKYMNEFAKKSPITLKGNDKAQAKYYEGTVRGLGESSLDGEIFYLNAPAPIDGWSSATKLIRSVQPNPAKPKPLYLAKDTIEMLFTSSMTNNRLKATDPYPELTLKLLVRDDGTIEFAEWEYLRIEYLNHKYYGTYQIKVIDGKWNPNTSNVGRPGNSPDAMGTATWNDADKTITFTAKFTDTENQKRTFEVKYKFDEIYREYDTVLKGSYTGYEDYHSCYDQPNCNN